MTAAEQELLAALKREHRAVHRAINCCQRVGPGTWKFLEGAFGALMAAHDHTRRAPGGKKLVPPDDPRIGPGDDAGDDE